MPIRLIALDADDTLWHNETIFRSTQARFAAILSEYAPVARIEAEMEQAERRNLSIYGYGAKGFTLSMMETALDLTGDALPAASMRAILALGRAMMAHPVEPLPGVAAAVEELATLGRLILVTKGDLFHQEAKLAASGLGSWFSGVEIVSEKSTETYRHIFQRYGVMPADALMVGNSVRSDILPVLEVGGYAVLVPYPVVWSHEIAEVPAGHPRFREISSLTGVPAWVRDLGRP